MLSNSQLQPDLIRVQPNRQTACPGGGFAMNTRNRRMLRRTISLLALALDLIWHRPSFDIGRLRADKTGHGLDGGLVGLGAFQHG